MIIDQKGAHERILFEQYLQQLSGSSHASQQQLFPHNIHLSPGDAEILRSLKIDLAKLGFVIENLGENSFVISGIPSELKETDIEDTLERMIENHKTEAKSLDFDKNAILARSMAMNASVKEGSRLLKNEIEDIFNRLFACQAPEISPDGKKIVNIIPLTEIEKFVKK
jgi:DNA mismatch repair protein MutL